MKDRIGAAMIDDAIRTSALKPGMIIVEPTSGNTGIGVAYAAVARGYRCLFTMPETATVERRNLLRALGCKVVLTEGPWEASFRAGRPGVYSVQCTVTRLGGDPDKPVLAKVEVGK